MHNSQSVDSKCCRQSAKLAMVHGKELSEWSMLMPRKTAWLQSDYEQTTPGPACSQLQYLTSGLISMRIHMLSRRVTASHASKPHLCK